MDVEERAATLLSTAEECVGGEDELLALLHDKPSPICLHSFQPSASGRLDIAQGVGKVIDVNKMIRAGCRVKILIEDQRMGGDLSEIRATGHHMIEVWKALGMDLDGVEFLWSSEEISKRAHLYWPMVLGLARETKVGRLARYILHPNPDNVKVDQLWEPIMQCADILFLDLEADICQMGMDQREVGMMAREYSEHIEGASKPIFLLHHLLPGLKEGQQKMSNSDPYSAIFMFDDEVDVKSKIKKAFCPIKITEGNPCLEYIQHIVFPWFGKFEVLRNERSGGNRTYVTMEELLVDYISGALHPGDVKAALTKAINQILQPVRDHFNKNSDAKVLCNAAKV
ncbi:tyrosine--tRNA ligase 1, cytoplasmic-like [Lolium rigidum]|uniref:tyrosine--tRNA ligase 1, cytoplasmic-like n=1 Tax=Lolium rigidum TaxID=89674 RepID=UPI001F5C8C06|nr:tyrosine--tRNA ligase 1, cytoplasmic-like [Lolium rigidum]